jgi:hypothetical protein
MYFGQMRLAVGHSSFKKISVYASSFLITKLLDDLCQPHQIEILHPATMGSALLIIFTIVYVEFPQYLLYYKMKQQRQRFVLNYSLLPETQKTGG